MQLGDVHSKKFELISPKICKAGEILPAGQAGANILRFHKK
jgi:hypothetical protein